MTIDQAARVPTPIREIMARLVSGGHRSLLVGRCVRALLAGRTAGEFEVVTESPAAPLLTLFPRAVPIAVDAATIMIPTRSGPVDVTVSRAGARIEDALAQRDFTVDAIAYDPNAENGLRIFDPYAGVRDLQEGRLQTVGDAGTRLAEEPLRAVRAARLAAELQLEASPPLLDAMKRTAGRLGPANAPGLRREITPMLMAARPSAGLVLLRCAGIEATLAPETRADAAAVVERLAPELPLRLAGWLRGTHAVRILTRFRFPPSVVQDVETVLALHPPDLRLWPSREPELRRIVQRAGIDTLQRLFALREAELDVGALSAQESQEIRERISATRARIDRIREGLEQMQLRPRLALDGRAVMEILGIGPGPQVGRALRYLTERVREDPRHNTEAALRALLRRWSDSAT